MELVKIEKREQSLKEGATEEYIEQLLQQNIICLCCALVEHQLLPDDLHKLIRKVGKKEKTFIAFKLRDDHEVIYYKDFAQEPQDRFDIVHTPNKSLKEVKEEIKKGARFIQIPGNDKNHTAISELIEREYAGAFQRLDCASVAAIYFPTDLQHKGEFVAALRRLAKGYATLDILKRCSHFDNAEEMLPKAYSHMQNAGYIPASENFSYHLFSESFKIVPILYLLKVFEGNELEAAKFIMDPERYLPIAEVKNAA